MTVSENVNDTTDKHKHPDPFTKMADGDAMTHSERAGEKVRGVGRKKRAGHQHTRHTHRHTRISMY